MPELPLRGWVLLGAIVALSAVVLSVLYWAQFTGRAGSQRGLVIHNDLASDLQVEVEGLPRVLIAGGEEQTFVVKRHQFPAYITWGPAGGDNLSQQDFEYRDITDAEFRLSIDEQGIHPTTEYRDTPVPATATPEVSIVIHNDLDRVPIHVAVLEQGKDIEAASAATFMLDREDFPIYVYAMQSDTYEESFGRYVRGDEFEFDEVAAAGFDLSVNQVGIMPSPEVPFTVSNERPEPITFQLNYGSVIDVNEGQTWTGVIRREQFPGRLRVTARVIGTVFDAELPADPNYLGDQIVVFDRGPDPGYRLVIDTQGVRAGDRP